MGGFTFFFMGEGDTVPFLIAVVFTGSGLGAGLLVAKRLQTNWNISPVLTRTRRS